MMDGDLVANLAGLVEEQDKTWGVDTAPISVKDLCQKSLPDVAFEMCLALGMPAPDALEAVMQACDEAEIDRVLAFELVLIRGGAWL